MIYNTKIYLWGGNVKGFFEKKLSEPRFWQDFQDWQDFVGLELYPKKWTHGKVRNPKNWTHILRYFRVEYY